MTDKSIISDKLSSFPLLFTLLKIHDALFLRCFIISPEPVSLIPSDAPVLNLLTIQSHSSVYLGRFAFLFSIY